MPFYAYSKDGSHLRKEFRLDAEGGRRLWGKDGAVAKCAHPKLKDGGGPWSVSEVEVLRCLEIPDFGNDDPENPSLLQWAIIDDLIPNGPGILLARVRRIRGFLDPPYNPANPNDRYNPIEFELEQVLAVNAWQPGYNQANREQLKEVIPLPSCEELIRSINYLNNCWNPARRFQGALLWPKHWDYFREP